MNSVISFSLFGSAPLYCQGALRNAEKYPQLLPGWRCVFFVSSDVPQNVKLKLKQAGAELRDPDPQISNGMFWRFTVLDDLKVQRAIFRDTDSRPSQREVLALKEWEKSSKPFHSMADHVHHTLPLGGGLWGVDFSKFRDAVSTPHLNDKLESIIERTPCVPHLLRHVTEAIVKSRLATRPYKRETSYSLDQTFLTHFIWPLAKKHGVLRHDLATRHLFRESVPWPGGSGFSDLSFVGEIIDQNEQPNWNHRFRRLNYLA